MDPQRLKQNFAQVGAKGEDIAAFFYADLFARNPGLRGLFPAEMGRQQQMLIDALAHIVSQVDDAGRLIPFLQDLGRRHVIYGVAPEHYAEVGSSLLATLEHFSGPAWTEELRQDWAAAYGVVSQVMVEAAADRA
ncbi:MAG TPA: globin domain-containing protein [Streptosporangiaceae bacterium]|jgi:hemoglobin-like flavoprotein